MKASKVGRNLRRLRKERGLEQAELGAAAGSSQQTVSEIETGKRDPRESTLEKLAAALDVPVARFFGDGATGGHPPLPPRMPLADEREEDFDADFAATDAETAEVLQNRLGAEFDKGRGHVEALIAAGVSDTDFRLRQARFRLNQAKRRLYATTSRATDLALNAEFGRDRPIYNSVEAYAGKAEGLDKFHGAQLKRYDSAERAEKAGKAG